MHRAVSSALVVLTLGLAAACGDAERLAELEAQNAELETAQTALETSVAQLRGELDAAETKTALARSDVAHARRDLEAAEAELEQLRAELERAQASAAGAAEATAKVEELETKFREVESHRDELVEWVEGELLPLAEKHDPKLAALRDQTRAMAEQVEALRDLPFKRPVMRRLLDREEVGRWMQRDLRRELPEEDARAMIAVMSEFGIVSPDTDLYAMFADFLEAGAAAFYKPQTNTFYLIDGHTGRGNNPSVFHELVHAVEDQHFQLDSLLRGQDGESDSIMARKALVEGSADFFQERYHEAFPEDVAAMMQAMQGNPELMQKQMRMMTEVPAFLIASMGLFPYKNGSAFLRARGVETAADVEALFRDPPASTEQVLHPERYPVEGRRDYPHLISAPDLDGMFGDGWHREDSDELGELMIGLMLAHLSQSNNAMVLMSVMDPQTQGVRFPPAIAKAAEGWDGDRYTAYHHPETGEVVVVWSSVWDTDVDAREFAATYGRILGRRITGKLPSLDGESAGVELSFTDPKTEQVSSIHQAGDRVVVVLGAQADQAVALSEAGRAVEVTPDARDAEDAAR